jgi:ankyrin repeat protein
VDEELVTQNALRTVAFSRTGTSTVSFQSERDGEKTALTSKSHLSDVSAGRHGKKNRNSILQIEQNRRNMKMLMMFSAVKAGDLPTVQWCLKGGLVSINSSDSNSRSLLHIAAGNGNAEITEFLLKASANVNLKDKRGNTPLNDAVLACHDDIAAMIREHAPGTVLSLDGFQAGTKLCEAAAAGDLSQVQRLIKNGVSVNAHDYDGRTGLHLAACEGRAEIVTYLLQARAEPGAQDRFGGNALDDAIRHGHASIKQLVYEAGARVSGMDNTLKACAASAAGDPKAIDLTKSLVDNGLDPKMGNYDGRTPLHLAACSGKLGLLEYFISKIQAASGGSGSGGGSGGGHAPASGPAAEGTDDSSKTSDVPADCAGADEDVEDDGSGIVSRLPEGDFLGDSHFNVVDRHGCTPLDDAHRHGHAAAIVVLEKAGALRRGDPRLEASVSARRQRDKERLRLSQREAAQAYLSTSIESKAWEHCDGTVLPALHTFLHQLVESKREVEELARKVLPAVRAIIERYIRNVLPREMTIVRAKLARLSSFRREGSSAELPPR